jgi:hypothetical protein
MPYMDGGHLEAQQWLEYDERREQALRAMQEAAPVATVTQSTGDRFAAASEARAGAEALAAASLAEGPEPSSQSASCQCS